MHCCAAVTAAPLMLQIPTEGKHQLPAPFHADLPSSEVVASSLLAVRALLPVRSVAPLTTAGGSKHAQTLHSVLPAALDATLLTAAVHGSLADRKLIPGSLINIATLMHDMLQQTGAL